MARWIPFVIAAVAIIALTLAEGLSTDRWIDGSREQAYCASLLEEVPKKIGDWVGIDQVVDENIQKVAGAEGYVSRTYENQKTGKQVSVWLIVGHAIDAASHTPNICYPASGFRQCQNSVQHTVNPTDKSPVAFWTGMFNKKTPAGEFNERVFWTWFLPQTGGKIEWIAPNSPRFHFANARALYKLYFTTRTPRKEEAPEESICLEFADEFFAAVNPILEQANNDVPEDFVPQTPDAGTEDSP